MKFKCLPNSIKGEKRCQQCADRNLECQRIIPGMGARVSPKHVRMDLTMPDLEDASRRVVVSENVWEGIGGLGIDLNKT